MTQIKIVPEMPWSTDFAKSIAESTHPEIAILDGTVLVLVENADGGNKLQNCHGVTMAIELLQKNPKERITLSGWLPLEYVRKRKPEIDLLLGRENIRFTQLPFSLDEFIQLWKNPATEIGNTAAIEKYTSQVVAVILHSMKVENPKHPKNDQERSMVDRALIETRKHFPSLNKVSDEEVLDFLQEAATKREEVRKGEYLQGVFCDCEGTLIVDGNINTAVLEWLKVYEAAGKTVTMWTDGDTAVIGMLLNENSIPYSLHRKREFAGAEVEIAIDDMDEFAFSARTKITARTFIRA